jgi:hypothetical protein
MGKSIMDRLRKYTKTIIIIVLVIFVLLILLGFFLGPDKTWQPLGR